MIFFFKKRPRRAGSLVGFKVQSSAGVPHLVLWDEVYAAKKPVFGHASHSQKTVPLSGQDTFRRACSLDPGICY